MERPLHEIIETEVRLAITKHFAAYGVPVPSSEYFYKTLIYDVSQIILTHVIEILKGK